MKLLLYANQTDETGVRLKGLMEALVPSPEIECCFSVEGLSARFCRKIGDLAVVVFCPANREELEAIILLKDLLSDLRTVLILPESDGPAISRGLTLQPRYFCFKDSDFSDLSIVLTRILRIYSKETDRWERRRQ